MNTPLAIRAAGPEDVQALLDIYAPYVEKTAITFEYDVPSAEEFAGRMEGILKRYPYLVAERDGEIVGYAYASAFHPRAAYGWCAEMSVYVRMDGRGGGAGGALYRRLEEILIRQGVLNLNACIACTDAEDEYLTNDSVSFHEHMGYRLVGKFTACGWKFGRWYDMLWMEKLVGEHSGSVREVEPFGSVRAEFGL